MKKQEYTQIKGLDLKELENKVKALREEIANLVMDKNMKKLKDPKMVSKKKKELAQILTVIKQKELLVQLESRVESQESSEKEIKSQKSKVKSSSKNLKVTVRKEKTSH